MKDIHVCNKGRYLNALEEYKIYKDMRESPNNHLTDLNNIYTQQK